MRRVLWRCVVNKISPCAVALIRSERLEGMEESKRMAPFVHDRIALARPRAQRVVVDGSIVIDRPVNRVGLRRLVRENGVAKEAGGNAVEEVRVQGCRVRIGKLKSAHQAEVFAGSVKDVVVGVVFSAPGGELDEGREGNVQAIELLLQLLIGERPHSILVRDHVEDHHGELDGLDGEVLESPASMLAVGGLVHLLQHLSMVRR
mmetsp:Transcript_7774/g.29163  ORF Transcript_7774/g.29163 Transcript_7774/m.29163 type:complete len:204 (+) Transcript_7774:2665-3276(+)